MRLQNTNLKLYLINKLNVFYYILDSYDITTMYRLTKHINLNVNKKWSTLRSKY